MIMIRMTSSCRNVFQRSISKRTATLKTIETTTMLRYNSSTSTSTSTSTPKKSGLQKQVLGLYRNLLRTSHAKRPSAQQTFPESLADPSSTVFAVKHKFRTKADSVSRRDVDRIEYYIRQGEKYIKTLDMNGVTGMRSVWWNWRWMELWTDRKSAPLQDSSFVLII